MPRFHYRGRNVEFAGNYTGSYDCINNGRFYEQTFLERISELGLSGTYLDIGTNIGNHALYFAMFCPSERVIGFEPMTSWRARALENLSANHCSEKVTVYPVGLLDKTTQLTFNPYGTPHVLECTTLDELLPDLTGVSFVKMDIEGSEPQALLGGRNFFRRNRPMIVAEVLDSPNDLFRAAEEINYHHSGLVYPGTPMYELLPNN